VERLGAIRRTNRRSDAEWLIPAPIDGCARIAWHSRRLPSSIGMPAFQGCWMAGVGEAVPGVIDLRPLFAPRSIAVVGASPRSWIAETVRDNLRVMGSETRCHFVNPRYEELHGQPCYPSLDALPERPDIAIVALNPLRAASVTQAAAAAGVPAVIIPGGGVVEGGEAAAAMQLEVGRIAREHGLALLGPNCMGIIDLVSNSATYIGDVSPYLPRGGVAGIAQSGSVTDAFVHSGNRVGFSRIISCGSEVVLDVCDYLAYCLDDPETSSVILFLEGFKRPERFLALADRALQLGKPIMAVKVGRSVQAQAAAVAHSGSLAGETRVTDAALDAAGVLRCRDLDELLETAELVEGVRRTGRRVGRGRSGVVTVSTGEASLIADLVPETGLDLPPIPASARSAILDDLPTMGYIGNPLDPWGAADPATAYRAAFEAMAASAAYDVLVLVHDFPYRSLPSEVATANEVTRALLAATAERPAILPVYVSLTSGEPPSETKTLLDSVGGGAPLLRGAVEAFRAIAGVARWEARHGDRVDGGAWREGWPAIAADRTSFGADPVPGLPPTRRPVTLSERESLAFAKAAGIAVTEAVGVTDAAAAVGAARAIGRPVALKLDAVGLAHKSDIGGVVLGLRGDDAVYAAALTLLETGRRRGLAVRGLLVEAMAAPGVELILGLRRDPQFGPAVVVGLGGTLTEVLDDVAIRLAPLDPGAADAMLDALRGARLLRGIRGRPPVDRGALVGMLVALGRLGVERSDVLEVDLNPVIASLTGAIAVDALVVLEGPGDART
jgi:acyl-CoA synthetase (NDP forming)